jgi:hypothetical protein
VVIGGQPRGQIRAGEPVTIEGLPPGEVEVVVKRAGARDCREREIVDPTVPKVVTCRFASAPSGQLLLNVLTEGATVLLDKQEISPQAAREPLIVSADTPHEVVVKKDGFVTSTLTLTVRPGEVLPQRVELAPLPPPPRPERSPPRAAPPSPSPSRELLAPGERQAGAVAPAVAAPPPGIDEDAAPGYLVADSTPWARVLVDGVDTGKMTPIAARAKIPLPAGKHVVTFVVGERRWSYNIMVEPGVDYVLKKELPVAAP